MKNLSLIFLFACLCVTNCGFNRRSKVSGQDYKAEKIHILQDNMIIAGLLNSTSLIYDTDFNVIASIEHAEKMSAVDWNSNYLVLASFWQQVEIYDINTWEKIYTSDNIFYEIYPIDTVAISSDSTHAAASAQFWVDNFLDQDGWIHDNMIKQQGQSDVTSLTYSRDDQWLVSSSGEYAQIMKWVNNKWAEDHLIECNGNAQTKIAISDDFLAISQHDNEVHIYKVSDWSLETIITLPNEMTNEVTFDKNTYLGVSTKDKVYIINVGTWDIYQTLDLGEVTLVHDIKFSDSKLAVSFHHGEEGTVALFEQGSGASYLIISTMLFAILSLLF